MEWKSGLLGIKPVTTAADLIEKNAGGALRLAVKFAQRIIEICTDTSS